MSENYAVINGKRIKLTDDQAKALGVETRKNPFERVARGEVYSLVGAYGYPVSCHDDRLPCDNNSFLCHNYFNDKEFAQQVALHQLLYRKLLKFAYDNECEDTEWNNENNHWLIFYDSDDKEFSIEVNDGFKFQGAVYFSNSSGAERAIREVVVPFVKEHPEFVW